MLKSHYSSTHTFRSDFAVRPVGLRKHDSVLQATTGGRLASSDTCFPTIIGIAESTSQAISTEWQWQLAEGRQTE